MEDDLEYYITFPTPTPKGVNGAADDDEEFEFISGNNGEREPVVFLLGWLGAQDRHLAKYCNIYKERGCITIRYTSPPSYIFFRPNYRIIPVARKLITLLQDMSLHQHPIFFHIFSNNGSVLYYYLTQAMAEDGMPRISVRGCIFDSTPAPRRIYSGVRAAYAATPGSKWKKLCVSVGMFVYLVSWKVISVLWSIISGKLPNHPPWALVEENSRWPQLFLYSKADKLIGFEDIEYFMAERKKLGVCVVSKCWNDSPHVQHYRVYPEEYRQCVYGFLSKCLLQEPTPPITLQPFTTPPLNPQPPTQTPTQQETQNEMQNKPKAE